jgi:creatinine amidohydrolase
MEALTSADDGKPRGRLAHLPDVSTSIDWHADYPTHYAGDARTATAEKGEFMFQVCVERLVKQMRAIKSDTVAPALQDEFYRKASRPAGEGG